MTSNEIQDLGDDDSDAEGEDVDSSDIDDEEDGWNGNLDDQEEERGTSLWDELNGNLEDDQESSHTESEIFSDGEHNTTNESTDLLTLAGEIK